MTKPSGFLENSVEVQQPRQLKSIWWNKSHCFDSDIKSSREQNGDVQGKETEFMPRFECCSTFGWRLLISLIPQSPAATCSGCDAAAGADRGHSGQCLRFHQMHHSPFQKHPWSSSTLCSAKKSCQVCFWQKPRQTAQSKSSTRTEVDGQWISDTMDDMRFIVQVEKCNKSTKSEWVN